MYGVALWQAGSRWRFPGRPPVRRYARNTFARVMLPEQPKSLFEPALLHQYVPDEKKNACAVFVHQADGAIRRAVLFAAAKTIRIRAPSRSADGRTGRTHAFSHPIIMQAHAHVGVRSTYRNRAVIKKGLQICQKISRLHITTHRNTSSRILETPKRYHRSRSSAHDAGITGTGVFQASRRALREEGESAVTVVPPAHNRHGRTCICDHVERPLAAGWFNHLHGQCLIRRPERNGCWWKIAQPCGQNQRRTGQSRYRLPKATQGLGDEIRNVLRAVGSTHPLVEAAALSGRVASGTSTPNSGELSAETSSRAYMACSSAPSLDLRKCGA
ncbi:hypothetical protein DFH11DRAFT_1743216 [Phellopilus nigrolimitatus]|nr:hypothetical protein DFH11DRAFT_1743216 [Phellopilus nigrolimitatus]